MIVLPVIIVNLLISSIYLEGKFDSSRYRALRYFYYNLNPFAN